MERAGNHKLLDELLAHLRAMRDDDAVRATASWGRKGLTDVLREWLPPPSKSARKAFNLPPDGTWMDWVERFSPERIGDHTLSKTGPIPETDDAVGTDGPDVEDERAYLIWQLDQAYDKLHWAVEFHEVGQSLPNPAAPLNPLDPNELTDVGEVLYAAVEIAKRFKRRHSPHEGTTRLALPLGIPPWCALCGTAIPIKDGKIRYYCDAHNPTLNPPGYKAASRRADTVISKVVPWWEIEVTKSWPTQRARQYRLRRMWRWLRERVGVFHFDLMQDEFERLAPLTTAERKRGLQKKVFALLQQGLNQSQVARELGVSRQYVSRIVREEASA